MDIAATEGRPMAASLVRVRSTKEILARCMRDRETPPHIAEQLLDGLPDTFDEWYQDAVSAPPAIGLAA
jgi:hypothetical protein